MEMTVKAGNGGAAGWLDDGGRPRRTGTFWAASAHITAAAIGSVVVSLAWAIGKQGWVAGPAAVLLFAFVTYYTAKLLAECYRTGDPETGKRNYTYMDAEYANLVGAAIGYAIVCSIVLCQFFAEYMCIGRRARALPRTGTVKGCNGRAREAVPAGRGHGIIPTFRRAGTPKFRRIVRRTGDISLPRRKRNCDWSRIMGSTVISTDDGSCAISASVMCMEARCRRLISGKYHGANSCFLKVMPEAVESLKDMCKERGAWKPKVGARTLEGVLEVIRSLKKGIPTVNDDSISLRLKSYETFVAGKLSPLEVTAMIQKKGPVIGVLYAGGDAYFRSIVYRGNRAFPANHVVVCTGYQYVNGELCIKIMDNLAFEGPIRFVLYKAFEEFHVLTVDVR